MAESLLKELPVHNSDNFSRFQADTHKRSCKKPPVYVPTSGHSESVEIVTEKTSILLRYLHQTWERKCPRRKRDLYESRTGSTEDDNNSSCSLHTGVGQAQSTNGTAPPRVKRPRQDTGSNNYDFT